MALQILMGDEDRINEDGPDEKTTVRLPAKIYWRLKEERLRLRIRSETQVYREAIELWLERANSTESGAGAVKSAGIDSADIDNSATLSKISTTKELAELRDLCARLAEKLSELLAKITSSSGENLVGPTSGDLLDRAERELAETRQSDAALIKETEQIVGRLPKHRKGKRKNAG